MRENTLACACMYVCMLLSRTQTRDVMVCFIIIDMNITPLSLHAFTHTCDEREQG